MSGGMKPSRWNEYMKNYTRTKRKTTGAVYREVIINFLLQRDGQLCGICGNSLENSKFHIDHKIAVIDGGLHNMHNLQLSHPKCNSQKEILRRKMK
jgi:5-methylcytosine-specific restriction endonuclease McrA